MTALPAYIGFIAQILIGGVVKDAGTKETLPGAFVCVYSGDEMRGSTMSDDDGTFTLAIKSDPAPDRISVSLLGYSLWKKDLDTGDQNIVVVMKESRTVLKSSVVQAQSVEEKGDTVSYYVNSFADGSEEKLADLIMNLPGVSVTESGGISINGKPISRFYVGGLDLMGSQYGVVVQNLSPDKIARIDVYKRHQGIKVLKGIGTSDRDAVNIVLKESARGTLMFTGNAALGFPGFPEFDARGLFTRFGQDNQSLFLLKGNSVGKDILKELSEQEYLGRKGVYVMSDEIDHDLALPVSPRKTSLSLPKEMWYDNESGTLCLNNLTRTGKDAFLRLAVSGAAENYYENTGSEEMVDFGDGEIMAIRENSSMADRQYFVRAAATYEKNSDDLYLSDELRYSGKWNESRSVLSGGGETFSLPSFKISNALNTTTRLPGKKVLKIYSDTKYVKNSSQAAFNSAEEEFSQNYSTSEFVSANTAGTDISAGRYVIGLGLNANVYHYELDASADGAWARATYRFGAWDFQPGAEASVSVKLGSSDLRLAVPMEFHCVSVSDGRRISYPSARPHLSLSGHSSGPFTYNLSLAYSDTKSSVESLSGVDAACDYRHFIRPDSLMRTQVLQAMAKIDYSDNIAMFYASVSAYAISRNSDRSTAVDYAGDVRFSSYTPGRSTDVTRGIDMSLKKYFGLKALVAEFRSGYRHLEMDQLLQSAQMNYGTGTFNASLMLKTNPCKWFSAELDLATATSRVSGSSESVSGRESACLSMVVSPLDPLMLKAEIYCYSDRMGGVRNSNRPLLGCEARWKFRNCFIFLRGANLLDADTFTNRYVSAYRSFSVTRRLPGIVLLAGFALSL